jgi:hypothetical protein
MGAPPSLYGDINIILQVLQNDLRAFIDELVAVAAWNFLEQLLAGFPLVGSTSSPQCKAATIRKVIVASCW